MAKGHPFKDGRISLVQFRIGSTRQKWIECSAHVSRQILANNLLCSRILLRGICGALPKPHSIIPPRDPVDPRRPRTLFCMPPSMSIFLATLSTATERRYTRRPQPALCPPINHQYVCRPTPWPAPAREQRSATKNVPRISVRLRDFLYLLLRRPL